MRAPSPASNEALGVNRSLGRDARDWPLHGRRAQRRALAEAMDVAGCRGAVLVGQPGAGKTRLAAEAATLARERGCFVKQIFATRAAASIALGAFAPGLPLAGVAAAATPELLCRAKGAMIELAGQQRLVVVIDDAHLLDDCSAALAYDLVTSDSAFVVASLIRGAPAADAVTALLGHGSVRPIDVPPLTAAEISALLREVLGSHVEGATVYAVFRTSQGLPLLVHDLVRAGLASGYLRSVEGVWRWRGPILPGPTVTQAILQRVDALAPPDRHLVRLLAVAGPLDAALVESLSSREAVTSVDEAGFLDVSFDQGGEMLVGLADPLMGAVLQASNTPLQLRAFYRLLAEEAVYVTPNSRAEHVRHVAWRLDGGHLIDGESLTGAARDSLPYDHSLAERLARAAIKTGDQFEARMVLGESLIAQGRADDGEAVLVSIDRNALTSNQQARLGACRAANLFRNLGRPQDAEALLRLAATQACDPAVCEHVASVRSQLFLHQGRLAEAAELASSIGGAGSNPREYEATAVASYAWAMSGRTDTALATLTAEVPDRAGLLADDAPTSDPAAGLRARTRSDQLPEESADDGDRRNVLDGARWEALWFSGRFAEAEALAHSLYLGAISNGRQGRSAMAAMRLGLIARVQGTIDEALGWLQEAVFGFREVNASLLPAALAALAQAAVLADDRSGAEAALRDADATVGGRVCDELRVELSRAWVAWARGEQSLAIRLALASADAAREHRLFALEAISLHDVVRLGAPAVVAARLREVANSLDGVLFPIMGDHGEALAADSGIALLGVAERFAELGYRLFGAEIAAEAVHARNERCSNLTRIGHRRLFELANSCPGVISPALTSTRQRPSVTPREQEISTMAARGLSSRQIADSLEISVRTVDNLLHRAYIKLGVHNRRELASTLGRGPDAGQDGPTVAQPIPADRGIDTRTLGYYS